LKNLIVDVNGIKEYTETLKEFNTKFENLRIKFIGRVKKLKETKIKDANFKNYLSKKPSIILSYENKIKAIEAII
jgi:uncharacterized membrane protein (DUF106 family)